MDLEQFFNALEEMERSEVEAQNRKDKLRDYNHRYYLAHSEARKAAVKRRRNMLKQNDNLKEAELAQRRLKAKELKDELNQLRQFKAKVEFNDMLEEMAGEIIAET